MLSRLANATWTAFNGDSFTIQYDSLRVARGAVPYRDFFSFLGPGTLWLQGLVFRMFGPRSLNAVYLLIFTLAVTGAALYLLSYALTGRWLASWFAPLFLYLGMAGHFPYPYHEWFAAPFAPLALVAAARWLTSGRRGWLAASGALCAATGLFLQTEGIALALAVAVFLVLQAATDADRPRVPPLLAVRLGWFGIGILAVALPVALYFAIVGGLRSYLFDTLLWPPLHYGCREANCVNNLPFLSDLDYWLYWGFSHLSTVVDTKPILTDPARFYGGVVAMLGVVLVPVIVVICGVRLLIGRLWGIIVRRRNTILPAFVGPRDDLLMLCSLATIALAGSYAIGVNLAILHLMWLTILAFPTLLAFVSFGQRPGTIIGYADALLACLVLGAGMWYTMTTNRNPTTTVDAVAGQITIFSYAREHTTEGDTIVVFPTGGTVYFYGRDAAIGYTFVLPNAPFPVVGSESLTLPPRGFYTADQYREMAKQIETRRPKLIMFVPIGTPYEDLYWRSFPPDLYQFVQANYGDEQGQLHVPQKVTTPEGEYLVYIRRDGQSDSVLGVQAGIRHLGKNAIK